MLVVCGRCLLSCVPARLTVSVTDRSPVQSSPCPSYSFLKRRLHTSQIDRPVCRLLRGALQWSECWDLNELGSLRGGGVEVPQKPGSLVLLDHF